MNSVMNEQGVETFGVVYRNSFEEYVRKEKLLAADLRARDSKLAHLAHRTSLFCEEKLCAVMKYCWANL